MADILTLAKNKGKDVVADFAKDNPKFLFVSAAVGWVLASLAQTVNLVLNKNITKEDKKYLVPQEILDGAANIALYAAITMPLMKTAEKMVDSGKIAFKNIEKGSAEFAQLKGGVRVVASLVGAVISSNIITPIVRNKVSSKVLDKFATPEAKTFYYTRNVEYERIPTDMKSYLAYTKSGMKI